VAGAAVPLVLSAVQFALPLIPSVISFVESIFGSGQKKQAAVDLLKSTLTTLANAGKLPSAAVLDPGLTAALGDAIQKQFDAMSGGTGKVPLLGAAGSVSTGKPLSASIVSGNGRSFLVMDVT